MTNATATAPATARPNTSDMIMVHNVFRRMFGDAPQVVRAIADGDTERAGFVCDGLAEVALGLQHHHEGEDELVWPLLLDRVGPEVTTVLRAEEQHERIHELLERMNLQIVVFREHALASQRDALADTIVQLDKVLTEHTADEERYVLPLIERYMSVAEWEAVGERGRAGIPKDRLLVQLGWILDSATPEQRKDFVRHLPIAARVAYRLVGHRVWEKERVKFYGR